MVIVGTEGFREKPQTFLPNFAAFKKRFTPWEVAAPVSLGCGQLQSVTGSMRAPQYSSVRKEIIAHCSFCSILK